MLECAGAGWRAFPTVHVARLLLGLACAAHNRDASRQLQVTCGCQGVMLLMLSLLRDVMLNVPNAQGY